MTSIWNPVLSRTSHTFLSTLALSSTHDEIMARGQAFEIPQQYARLTWDRNQSRSEVVALLIAALNHPSQRKTDETFIAVLQLVNTDLINCNVRIAEQYQKSLHEAFRLRQSLTKLGISGLVTSFNAM